MTGSHHAGRGTDRRDGVRPADDAPTETLPVVRPGGAPDDCPTDRVPRVPIEAPYERLADDDSDDRAPARDEEPADADERPTPTMLEQMGGVAGVVYSTVPVAVFIVVNILTSLKPAIFAALGVAVVIAIVRLVRKEALQPAISGLIGVAVCAFIAARSGQARDFYLPGLLLSAGLGLACLVSVVIRRPLAGVIWHGINGEGQTWRADPRLLRAYMFATSLWAVVFAARVVVQGWLYNADEANWLGVARLVMGYPLMGVALLGTFLAVRHARAGRAAADEG